jgi:3-oxoacyl-(acyl-carrier-protein) synthase
VTSIIASGIGAVSPAGWGVGALRAALARGTPIPVTALDRPGSRSIPVRPVPKLTSRPAELSHARLRRTSPISQYAVFAALEALGEKRQTMQSFDRLGIIVCVMAGSVNYSRRFYNETLTDPSTASPVVFPETVFNAPASHLAALLGASGLNYTLVGDPGTFLIGLALGAQWLSSVLVDHCLVLGIEELDWITTEALRLFSRDAIAAEGAGALLLERDAGHAAAIELAAITDSHLFLQTQNRFEAAKAVRAQLPELCVSHLLCSSTQGIARLDKCELNAWRDWTGNRVAPKELLGEGLAAASAWQCVAAADALQTNQYTAANVSVVGCNQQAIGAHFIARRL